MGGRSKLFSEVGGAPLNTTQHDNQTLDIRELETRMDTNDETILNIQQGIEELQTTSGQGLYILGNYAAGMTIENDRQYVRYNGDLYHWTGDVPFTTTGSFFAEAWWTGGAGNVVELSLTGFVEGTTIVPINYNFSTATVYFNGQRQVAGEGNDVLVSPVNKTITFNHVTLGPSDVVIVVLQSNDAVSTNLAAIEQAVDDAKEEIQQILESAGDQSALVVLAQPNGAKNIGRCGDIATLRTIEPTSPGQKIEVVKYSSDYKPITGYFEYDQTDSTTADDGGICIVTAGGKRWKRIFDGAVNVAWFGIPSDGDITSAVNKAIAYSKPKRLGLVISAGQYKYTGSTMLEIDLGFISLVCPVGCASIDFSGVTSTYAINVYSSAAYPDPLYRNTVNKLAGVECFGAKVAGKNGLLIGRAGGAQYYNGQCCIEHCSFHDFDYVVSCTNSTWRYKFNECVITKGITSIFYAPSGLLDSGESITFNGGMIADASGAPIIIACDAFNLGLDGTSTLNTRVQITGNGATVSMSGMGNIENPGQSTWYPYVTCTGAGARFILSESTLTINQPSAQTQPVIYVGSNAFAIFNAVKFPGNSYKFEQNSSDGVRAFVEGPGSVICNACTSDITSGAGNIPVHRSLSPIYNSGFEQGNNTGWSINNSSSPSQTAVVAAAYAKAGSYGMRMTSIAGLSIFATQQFNVKPGQYYMTSFWAKVVSIGANGNAAGNINLSFYSQNGTQIAGPTANLPVSVTDWAVYGNFIRGIVPPGAATAVISMRAYDGAVVDFDGVLINFI